MPSPPLLFEGIAVAFFVGACGLVYSLWRSRADLSRVREVLSEEIRARKQATEQLAVAHRMAVRSDITFRATFDNAAIGLAHVAPDGRFLRVNRHLCEIVGYSENELLARTFADITHPEDLAEDWGFVNQLLQGTRETYTLEKRYITAFGTTVWVNLTVSLLRRSDGRPDYFISAVEKIDDRKAAEQKLKERDQELATIFDEGSLGDWVWDVSAGQVTAHGRFWEMFGLSETNEPRPASAFRERVHPEDMERLGAEIRAALEHDQPVDVDFRVIRPDSSVRWLACRGTLVRDAEGKPVQIRGINIDITARKEAEAALARSAEEFRNLINVLPQLIWFAKPDGAIEFYNDRWYEYTGQRPEYALEWGWKPVVHPDDSAECLQRWRRCLETAQIYEIEYRLRAADGAYQWFLGRGIPMRDEQGRILRWFGCCTNIDQIKQAEAKMRFFNQQLEMRVVSRTAELLSANEELSQTQARLQSVLDSATQVAIIALDKQGVVQLFNTGAENMLGFTAANVIGRETMHRFEHAEQQAERAQVLGRAVSPSEIYSADVLPPGPYTRETVLVRADGTGIDVSLASAPMLDARGNRTGTLQILTDISRRKQLEAELVEQSRRADAANRAKSEFLAVMSHEIRTPMNAILGMADLLWETRLDPVQKEYVERFRRAGAKLLTLINDLLDLSKIESGRFELERIEFDLEEVFAQVSELMNPGAAAKNLLLTGRIAPGVPTSLIGDPARLQQILLNLVGNAVKFTEQGEVVFTVQQHPSQTHGHLLFEVRDTGIGISPEVLDTIFNDFTQADGSITRRFGGTGLGLGISRRLVRRFGGELTVSSTPRQGTAFSFDAVFAVGAEQAHVSRTGAQNLSGQRVLIVDNNETNRLIFAEMCASCGMVPVQLESARAVVSAIIEARQHGTPFSLLIIDRLMPAMDGFQLVEEVRRVDQAVPIILTTSDDQPGDATRAQSMRLSYARKPLRRAELLRLISMNIAPQTTHSSEVAESLLEPEQSPNVESPVRILVAEDSEDNRFLVESYLTGAGFNLTLVENGAQALERFEAEDFDIVLMDVQMPVLDGLSATLAIREYERVNGFERTPILALTANARPEDFKRSASAGCDGHVAKPITKGALLTAIGRHLKPKNLDPKLVRVPPGLQAAARRYIRTRKTEIDRLRDLLEKRAFEELRVLAHNMKGAGQSFGFPPLTALGAEMEAAAQQADLVQLRDQIARMDEYVQYAASVVLKETSGD